MNRWRILTAGAVVTALAICLTCGVSADENPFASKDSDDTSSSAKVNDSESTTPSVTPSVKPLTDVTKKSKSKKPSSDAPSPDDDKRPLRDRSFHMNSEGYLIIGNNTYRLRSISGKLMAGGLCTFTVQGDITRNFNGRWTGTQEKPVVTITSGNIGTAVDGRGSMVVIGLTASFIGFSGRVGNDFYRVKMPVGPGEGGYWLNGKWQDNRDGSSELPNPPDKPVNGGTVVTPSNYWTGGCNGRFEAPETNYFSQIDEYRLDARTTDRVSLTINNLSTGDRWTIWGIVRLRKGDIWELDPYLVNNTQIMNGRWVINFSAFRRRVVKIDITGDTNRGGFRAVMQQVPTSR
ncbi:MAG: hypothetical protein ACYC1M_00230 [Armatimonadota bacterium]